jgi:hypothetical protein
MNTGGRARRAASSIAAIIRDWMASEPPPDG